MTTENTHPIVPVSYQSICPINTPKGVRRKLHIGDIFENKAKCVICNDVVMSKNRHDSVSCYIERLLDYMVSVSTPLKIFM